MSSTGAGSIYAPPAFQAAVYAKENNYCTARVRFLLVHLIKPPDIFLFLTNFKPKNIDSFDQNKQKILMPTATWFQIAILPKKYHITQIFQMRRGKEIMFN